MFEYRRTHRDRVSFTISVFDWNCFFFLFISSVVIVVGIVVHVLHDNIYTALNTILVGVRVWCDWGFASVIGWSYMCVCVLVRSNNTNEWKGNMYGWNVEPKPTYRLAFGSRLFFFLSLSFNFYFAFYFIPFTAVAGSFNQFHSSGERVQYARNISFVNFYCAEK